MCGIIGFNWNDKKLLKIALKKMSHRGPDNSGTYLDKKISLGHNRLSIIDLSRSGDQPLSNEDKTIWITFNGEIYNFKEIRKNLKQKHKFKSNTDTELLVHLYEEDGEKMLHKLQGMFAFCIYDSEKKILFLARDRAGVKPLYYYSKNKDFIFASEIKSILESNKIKRKINLEALSSYLTFRVNTLEESMIEGIKKLLPGHLLIYNLENNNIGIEKYWDVKYAPKYLSEEYYSKELYKLLDDAVKSRLMSDVPFGAYLSGGVDSGAIVSLMSKHSSKPIKTFSVGFKEDEHSELNEARFLAKKLKTDHHELIISRDSIKELPKIIYHSDEPNADPTIIPIYFLAKYNKKYSTVILTGEGADELFAGYPQYKFMKIHNYLIRKLPNFIRSLIIFFIKKFPHKVLNRGFSYASALGEKGIERFSKFLMSNNYSEQYLNQLAIFNEEEQSQLLNKQISLYDKFNKYFTNPHSKSIVSECQNLDLKNPMIEGLLMKIDKNTMAFSVEARVPFLDYRIIEFSANIPERLKLKGFSKDKYILRKSIKEIIPKETMKRKKHHFFVPIDSWLSQELNSLVEKFLSEEYIKKQDIFNYNYIIKIKKEFEKSKLFYARQLWALIVFQIWYKQYIENEKVKV